MLHRRQLFFAGPGDGEQKGGVADGFHVVTDRGGKRVEATGGEIVGLAMHVEADVPLQDLNGEAAVSVVFLHAAAAFHRDEDDPEIVLLEERLCVETGLPGLLLFGVGDLFEKVELRLPVNHCFVL
jgi:hypothetical protein